MMNFSISPKQNVITFKNKKYKFIAFIGGYCDDCEGCSFWNIRRCDKVPCTSFMRIDQRKGIFKLKK